jgi:hypothetical protein
LFFFLLYFFHHVSNFLHIYAPSLLFLSVLLYTFLIRSFVLIVGVFHLYFTIRPILPLLSHCLLLTFSFPFISLPSFPLYFPLPATFLLFPRYFYYFTVFKLLHASTTLGTYLSRIMIDSLMMTF